MWTHTADHAASHHPYTLLFSPTAVEVRHVDTGELKQVVRGEAVRCVWDGRTTRDQAAESLGDKLAPGAHVYGVMTDPGNHSDQCIFAFTPALSLT